MNEILSRIAVDPRICFGRPCVRGTRIWVSLLLDFLASGAAMKEILENYPQLKRVELIGFALPADGADGIGRASTEHDADWCLGGEENMQAGWELAGHFGDDSSLCHEG